MDAMNPSNRGNKGVNYRKKISAAEWTTTPWLDNTDVMQLLHVSRNTLQTWRARGLIAYTKINSKIYFSEKDIQQFLRAYRRKGGRHKV